MSEAGPRLFEGSEHAILYRSFRPVYPSEVIDKILNFCSKKSFVQRTVVDVGCGSGQSTRYLAPYFEQVLGVDISENQVANARTLTQEKNVQYKIGDAETIPCESNSVDLVTSAQAFHWFNFERFFKEVDRVLKPGGCVALYGYVECTSRCENAEIQKAINDTYMQINLDFFGPYKDSRLDCLFNHYVDIIIPYEDKARESSEMQWNANIDSFFGFMRSFSVFQSCIQNDPEKMNIFNGFYTRLSEVISKCSNPGTKPEEVQFDLVSPVFILLGRKPSS